MSRASILLLTLLLLGLFSPGVLAQQPCRTTRRDDDLCNNKYKIDSPSYSCRNGDWLRHQMLLANQQLEQTGHASTVLDQSLRHVVDHAIAISNITSLIQALPVATHFKVGYENNGVYKAPEAFAGLALKELVAIWNLTQYNNFLQLRQQVRQKVEQALQLCPDTLQVDYTHVTQKLAGGEHKVHADNCFHTFEPILSPRQEEDDNNNKKKEQEEERHSPADGNTINPFARCNPHKTHPYHSRIVTSVLYLNEEFDGGQFYWANRNNGMPQDVVPAQIGRMVVFTSGPENLHGALPVLASSANATTITSPRRLALAMWYTLRESKPPEFEPIHDGTIATAFTSM